MFDYILTGPISGVSAGQYITGLLNELMNVGAAHGWLPLALINGHAARQLPMNGTSAVFCATVPFISGGKTSRVSKSPAIKLLK